MDSKGLRELIAKAAKKDKYLTDNEKVDDGAKRLVRRAFGFSRFNIFKSKVVKTLDEMAELLYGFGCVPSIEKGREIVPTLNGDCLDYNSGHSSIGGIQFNEVTNVRGEKRYQIFLYSNGGF